MLSFKDSKLNIEELANELGLRKRIKLSEKINFQSVDLRFIKDKRKVHERKKPKQTVRNYYCERQQSMRKVKGVEKLSRKELNTQFMIKEKKHEDIPSIVPFPIECELFEDIQKKLEVFIPKGIDRKILNTDLYNRSSIFQHLKNALHEYRKYSRPTIKRFPHKVPRVKVVYKAQKENREKKIAPGNTVPLEEDLEIKARSEMKIIKREKKMDTSKACEFDDLDHFLMLQGIQTTLRGKQQDYVEINRNAKPKQGAAFSCKIRKDLNVTVTTMLGNTRPELLDVLSKTWDVRIYEDKFRKIEVGINCCVFLLELKEFLLVYPKLYVELEKYSSVVVLIELINGYLTPDNRIQLAKILFSQPTTRFIFLTSFSDIATILSTFFNQEKKHEMVEDESSLFVKNI
jgi:hypothetical protein